MYILKTQAASIREWDVLCALASLRSCFGLHPRERAQYPAVEEYASNDTRIPDMVYMLYGMLN